MYEQHNKTLEHCIVTIVYLDSLSSLFSSKYCYGIIMDQLNMNNIKHHEKANTHSQITKNNTIQRSGLIFFSKQLPNVVMVKLSWFLYCVESYSRTKLKLFPNF